MKPNVENPGKVVITVATTGGLHGKEANPNLPEQPDEIVQSAYDCYNAGAAVHHIHARDPKGHPTADLRYYGEIVSRVKAKCPKMITQVGNGIGSKRLPDGHTTHFTLEERMALLNVQPHPDQLTVNCGTFTFGGKPPSWDDFLFVNDQTFNTEFVKGCVARGVSMECECYDLSHIANVLELVQWGVMPTPIHFSFVLGVRGTIPATPMNMLQMLDALPDGSSWQVVTIGRFTLPLGTMALALGGNIRVGLEDNVYYLPGELVKSNAQLVERAVRLARELGREIATPEEARKMLHLSP